MLNEEKIMEIKLKKKQGVSNSALMKEYKLVYAELRKTLDDIK